MNKLQLTLAALAAAGTLSLSTVAPASADEAASTRNIILGAAAIAGIAIEANVAHKNAETNTISGYLPDGSAVYGDGHVVARNGYSYYPGNNGQTVSCSNGQCSIAYTNGNANVYNDAPYNAAAYNRNPSNGNVYHGNPHNGGAYNGAARNDGANNRNVIARANGDAGLANDPNRDRGANGDR
jgi:hypothetical protein